MGFIYLFDVGEKNVTWKYFAQSCAILSLQRMTFMDWGEVVCFAADAYVGAFNGLFLFCLVIGIFHKPFTERLILSCGINFSFLKS